MKKVFFLLTMLIFSFPVFAQIQGEESESWTPKNLVEVMSPNGKYDNFVQTLSQEEVLVLEEGQQLVQKYLGYIKDIKLYDDNRKLNFNNANLMFDYLYIIKDFYERVKESYPNSGKALGAWIITQIVQTKDDPSYLCPLYLMFTIAGNMFVELGETERALAFVKMTKNIEKDYDAISAGIIY